MVALEAWAVGTPVIANAQCDVLLGQCLRSNAGLYYADAAEFAAVLDTVANDRALAERLGQNGRPVLRAALQLACDRTEIPRYVRIAFIETRRRTGWKGCQDGWPDGSAHFAPRRRSLTNCRRDRSSILIADLKGRAAAAGSDRMKLAFITPRYGGEIAAGAEHACRLLAEQLSLRHDVEVLTTSARDRQTWKNEYGEGADRVRGVLVRRFAVNQPHDAPALREFSDRGCWRRRAPARKKWTGSAGSGLRRQGWSSISSGNIGPTMRSCSSH